MKVFVRFPEAKYVIEVGPSDLTEFIKQKIRDKFNICANKQLLTFDGEELKDGRCMSDYNVVDGSTFYLTDHTVPAVEAANKAYNNPLCFRSDELLELVTLRKPLLITRCKNLGLSTEGKKDELLKRLLFQIGNVKGKDVTVESGHVLSENRILKPASASASASGTGARRAPTAVTFDDVMYGDLLQVIIPFLSMPEKLNLLYVSKRVSKRLFKSDIFSSCNFDLMPNGYHAIVFDHIIRNRTKLTELVLRVDLHEYNGVLGTIFANCNIEHLETLRVYFPSDIYAPFYFMNYKFRSNNTTAVTRAKAAIEKHSSTTLNPLSYLCTGSTTTSLKYLRMFLPVNDDFTGLLSLQNLITLEISIDSIYSDKFLEFLKIIENLRIKKFGLIVPRRRPLRSDRIISYTIRSKSLELIDFSKVGKDIKFVEIDCPVLKNLAKSDGWFSCIYHKSHMIDRNYPFKVSSVPFSQSNDSTLADRLGPEHTAEYYGVVGDVFQYCQFYPIILPPDCIVDI